MPATERIPSSGTPQGHAGYTNEAQQMDTIPDPFVQNLFVLCHGEQVNNVDVGVGVDVDANAGARPWDPPLTARGKLQAWRVGRKIRQEDWNVTRVVVSPFLRCVQTAKEVIAGLCMLPSSVQMQDKGHALPASVSAIKVSVECGLAENLMNKHGILLHPLEPLEDECKDWFQTWTLDLAELYSMLPTEIYDHPSFQPIKQKLPRGGEGTEDFQYRYTSTLNKIANRYPHENIIFITHGEGVRQSVSMMWPPTEVYGVTYCAFAHAQRPIFERDNGSYVLNGDWELLTESGSCSGIFLSSYSR